MGNKLQDIANFIRDWLFLDLNLNSTAKIPQDSSAILTIENETKLIINRVETDNDNDNDNTNNKDVSAINNTNSSNESGKNVTLIINLLGNNNILASSQLKVSQYVNDLSDPTLEEQLALKQYLKDTFASKLTEFSSLDSEYDNNKSSNSAVATSKATKSSGRRRSSVFRNKAQLQESFQSASEQEAALKSNEQRKSDLLNTELTDDKRAKLDFIIPPARGGGSGNYKPPDPNGPPGFEDEYKLLPENRKSQPISSGSDGGNASYGDSDLNPPGVGKHPSLKPYLDPLSSGNYGAPGTSGGMHPTSSDPLFHPELRNDGQGSGSSLQRPPGARWDDPLFGGVGQNDFDQIGQGLPGTGSFGARGGLSSNPLFQHGNTGDDDDELDDALGRGLGGGRSNSPFGGNANPFRGSPNPFGGGLGGGGFGGFGF